MSDQSKKEINHGNCKEGSGQESACKEGGSSEEGGSGQEGRSSEEGSARQEGGSCKKGSCKEGSRQEAHSQRSLHEGPHPQPGARRRRGLDASAAHRRRE